MFYLRRSEEYKTKINEINMNSGMFLALITIFLLLIALCVILYLHFYQNYNKKKGLVLEIVSTSIFGMSVVSFLFPIFDNNHEINETCLKYELEKAQRDVKYDCAFCADYFKQMADIKTNCNSSEYDERVVTVCQLHAWLEQNKDSIMSCVDKGVCPLLLQVPFSAESNTHYDLMASYLQKSICEYNQAIEHREQLRKEGENRSLAEVLFSYIYIILVAIAFTICIVRWCLEWKSLTIRE